MFDNLAIRLSLDQYSLAPVGGAFVATVGLALITGALLPRFQRHSAWAGLSLGIVAGLALGWIVRPPPPTTIQLASLAIAVAAEVVAFLALVPALYRAGERAVVAGTLAIVGGHFLLMLPAFGPLIAVLGGFCLVNAWALWRWSSYRPGLGWGVDGAIKVAVGTAMLTSL